MSGSTKNSAGAGDDATGMARVDIDPMIPSSVEVLGVFRKKQRIQYPLRRFNCTLNRRLPTFLARCTPKPGCSVD
jgi:hypothetical protein